MVKRDGGIMGEKKMIKQRGLRGGNKCGGLGPYPGGIDVWFMFLTTNNHTRI